MTCGGGLKPTLRLAGRSTGVDDRPRSRATRRRQIDADMLTLRGERMAERIMGVMEIWMIGFYHSVETLSLVVFGNGTHVRY